MSDTIEQQEAVPAPAAPQGGNGFAVTSLITGILALWPLGLIFGFLGLSRAKKVGKGKVMSWVGIVLSVIYIAATAFLYPHITKALDPGCRAAITVHGNYPDAKVTKDLNTNPTVGAADLQAEIKGFGDAAAKSKSATAKAAMMAEVGDLTNTLQGFANQTPPSAELQAKTTTDENAIIKACGGF
ncbi:MAG TPA: DUF4190 domain-containing protein [Micromonosporaceae bacterium]